jgi:hypothetical protein
MTIYYVSATNGNNNNSGSKPEEPLRTIQAAINKVKAGDTIYIRTGTYSERLHIQKPGTTSEPILIAAYQNEKPVLEGGNLNIADDGGLITIHQSQAVTLQGLELRNSQGRGLLITKSSQITLEGCQIHSCQAGGMQADNTDQIRIEGCQFYRCARRFLAGPPTLVYDAVALRQCQDIHIEGNQIFENSSRGITIWTGCEKAVVQNNTCYDNRNGQIIVTSSVDVTIQGNLCYHSGRSEFLTINKRRGAGIVKHDILPYRTGGKWHTRDLKVINNIVAGCGFGISNLSNRGKLTSTTIAHNTIVNSSEFGIKFSFENPSTNTFVENNLIASADDHSMARVKDINGIIWRHNLWSAFPGQWVHNPSSDVVESDVGLVNISAPIEAGKLTAEPYKLQANSIAIDKGIRNNGGVIQDFWGNNRDNLPDLGATEVPGRTSDDVVDPDLPAPGERVTNGLVVLYEFKEGQGTRVKDTSPGGNALDLTIAAANKVTWNQTGLLIKEGTSISSEKPATKIIDACSQSNEITIETWITPANVVQDGPARIVSISRDKMVRNVTLAQGLYGNRPADLFMTRLRTSWTSSNGLPPIVTPAGSASVSLTHLVYTRDAAGRAVIYINGQERNIANIVGQMNNWDKTMPLILANELSSDRPWMGELHLVAIYKRALSDAEVLHNYKAGQKNTGDVSAQFSIPAGLENGIMPHTVEFDSSDSVAPAGIATYFWEFGDGQTSNRPNPAHTYTKAGVYTVSLTITDTKGTSDKHIKSGFIRVSSDPFPPISEEYARFILVDLSDSSILAFGIQYPNLRCALMWNREPFHLLLFRRVEDVQEKYTGDAGVDLVWVDESEPL